jgi:hypothetical protein
MKQDNINILFVCIFITVLRLAQEFFTYLEMSPLLVKGYNLGQCSAVRAFEQGRIFIVPHQL